MARDVDQDAWRTFRVDRIERLPIPTQVESLGEGQCAFEPGSDDHEMLALYLGMLDADFEIVDSPELVDALRTLTRALPACDRLQHAGIRLGPRRRVRTIGFVQARLDGWSLVSDP